MIIPPDSELNRRVGYVVFVALPDEDGADGLVTYALGPFEDEAEARAAAASVQHADRDAFVRWTPLRRPARAECPISKVLDGALAR